MKLIIVQRSNMATYRRLSEQFAGDLNVKVILERRANPRMPRGTYFGSHRERRRLEKDFDGREFLVVHLADERQNRCY